MSVTDDLVDAQRVGVGAVGGLLAYLIGYLVTYVLHRSTVESETEAFNTLVDIFGGDPIPAWQAVGWLFYNAHFVRTLIPSFGGPESENFIVAGDGFSLTILYALPIVLLLVAGAAVAVLGDVDDPLEGAVSGMLPVLGYFPLAIAGVFVFSYSIADGTIQPDLITGALLAGVVYPLLFGAIGGGITAAVQSFQMD